MKEEKSLGEKQRIRRFYLYLVILIVFVITSFWSGYQTGRAAEREDWIDKVNNGAKPDYLNLESV